MRKSYRTHERHVFYKYMSANTAKIVLENCSLRWSSPIIFNDPFDVPREVMKNVNEITLGKALARKLKQELLNPRQDLLNVNPRIRTLLEIYKKIFPYGIPPGLAEKFQEIEIDPPVGPGAPIAIEDMKNMWRGMLNDRRILCLSESATIPPMWNHYADGYKGVVIEFECIDELDSAWLIAKPINYTNEMPLTYTAEGMADLLSLPDSQAIDYINNEITFIKTEDWTYEKEWRISTYAKTTNSGYYSDYGFHPLEVKSIILGPHFDDNDEDFTKLVQKYPLARIRKSTFGEHRKIIISP